MSDMNQPKAPVSVSASAPNTSAVEPVRATSAGTFIQTKNNISQVMAKRLLRFAERVLEAHGFGTAAEPLPVLVSAQGPEKLKDARKYSVCWSGTDGWCFAVVGILTNRGWPVNAYGCSIFQRQ